MAITGSFMKSRGTVTTAGKAPGMGPLALNSPGGKKVGGKVKLPAHPIQNAKCGMIAPDDPFFWFCQQNYSLHTYPMGNVPRQLVNEGQNLAFQYSDFVSRSGTP